MSFHKTLLLLLIAFSAVPAAAHAGEEKELFGSRDFIAYYEGSKILAKGGNPYDSESIIALKKADGYSGGASDLWNPPWAFIPLIPLSWLSFESAARTWFLLNILFTALTVIAAVRLWGDKPALPAVFFSLVLFPPLWEVIWLGQMNALLALIFAAFLLSLKREKYFGAGVAAFLFTIKAPLFYLLTVPVALGVIRKKLYGFVCGFLTAGIALAGLSFLISPDALTLWLTVAHRPVNKMASTLVTPVRVFIMNITGAIPVWPMWAVPLAASAVLVVVLLRRQSDLLSPRILIPTMALSLFTAPYGWFFDAATLLCGQLLIFFTLFDSSTSKKRRYLVLSLFLGLHLLSNVPTILWGAPQHYFFWYPLAFLGLWKLAGGEVRASY